MRKLRPSSQDSSRPCRGAACGSAGRGGWGGFQVKVRPPETRGLCPALLPHTWPCKLALTFPAQPLSFSPFSPNHSGEEGPGAGSPARAARASGLFAQLGHKLVTPPRAERHPRSSVYSGLSGSQRELFPSKMKRKQRLCQVNRQHCSQRWQAPLWDQPVRSAGPQYREAASRRGGRVWRAVGLTV